MARVAAASDAGATIVEFDYALREELGLTEKGQLHPPSYAVGWEALLALALVSLHTDATRDTLERNWQRPPHLIDANFRDYAKLGLVTGLGTPSLQPTEKGYSAIARYLVDMGRLEPALEAA
jgi:hypothetical protein